MNVRFQAICEGLGMVHREREMSSVPTRWRAALVRGKEMLF